MSSPARILRVITRLNIGGPAIQAIELSNRLTDGGCPTLLVHGGLGPGEGDMRARHQITSAEELFLPELRRPIDPLSDMKALKRLSECVRTFRPTIVHTHTAKAGALGRLAAVLYNRRHAQQTPIKIVHTYHGHVLDGYFSPVKTRLFEVTERWLARQTDAIVAISPAIAHELQATHRIGTAEQYRVIPLGFDLKTFTTIAAPARERARRQLGIAAEVPVVVSAGRLTAIKRFDLLLETAFRVRARVPNTIVLIAGDGELRPALEQQAAALGLGDAVRFLGWTNVADLYAAADVFLLTSKNEGTPVALIEAMAAGIPGVATDVGGVKDVISSTDLGACVSSESPDVLADAVYSFLADRDRRLETGSNARASTIARFDIDQLVSNVSRLYGELMTGGPARA